MAKPITQEQFDLAIDLYLSKTTGKEIQELSGVSNSAMRREMVKRGISSKWKTADRELQAHESKALEMYQAGFMIKDIEKATGLDSTLLYRLVGKQLGGSNRGGVRKTYEVKEPSYFESIDTCEKAYFFGLLFSDGHVKCENLNPTSVEITLAEKDSYILEYFCEVVGSSKGVESVKNGKYSRVVIHNVRMAKDLFNKGLVSRRKTFDVGFDIRQMDPSIAKSFARGLFDGDGTAFFRIASNGTFKSQVLQFLGSKNLMFQFSDFFGNLGCQRREPKAGLKENHSWKLTYHNYNDMRIIYQAIYNEGSIPHLTRKRECIETMLSNHYGFRFHHSNSKV